MENKTLLALPNWAIIPAAGVGKRMQSEKPKQYIQLAGKTILEHTLNIFIQHPLINGIVVSISDGDPYWPEIKQHLQGITNKPILVANGGKERSDSVLSALHYLHQQIKQDSWVLVHDAARPCLLKSDIDKLIYNLADDKVGGLLGLPINDTLKLSNSNQQVEKTISREYMWRALTPQYFKLLTLIKALELTQDQTLTDESSAIELLGLKPTLIEGHHSNIKITHPGDLLQAEIFLSNK
ncbi:MAG: 2-C-methyl-D-erythritol 4-phosphate cytidylyltransferase [Pseudomonadota bacterium]